MTTALSILNRAAEIIGYKDADEVLSGNDASNFLGVLNSLVDSWALNRLFIYAVTELMQSVNGNGITIGSGGTINTTRPIGVPAGGFFRDGSTDYGFEMISRDQYAAVVNKASSTPWPQYCYYEPSLPTGKLYFYPALAGSGELHLPVEQRLASFAALTTEYTLAPGYKRALEYSLAEELFPARVTPKLQQLASGARRAIETFEPGILRTGLECQQGNVLTGWN